MKIVYLYHSFSIIGGAERILTEKMNYLSQIGYDIYLITYLQGQHPIAFNLNNKIIHIDLNTRFFTLYKYNIFKRIILQYFLKKKFRNKLKDEIVRINPDMFISTTYSIDLFKQIIDSMNGIKCKKIIENHVTLSYLLEKNINNKSLIKSIIQRYINKKNIKFAKKFDSIVVLSNKESQIWKNNNFDVKIIPNFIPSLTDTINYQQEHSHSIICVGRLNKQKGFDLLIEAWNKIWNKYKEWHIDIYGEGEERMFLERRISMLGLEKSIIINSPKNDIFREYFNHSFLVLSSRAEGFGLVLAEAMSCGIPCVSFNCLCGPNEIIDDGIDGILAENGNIDDLAEKIEWMITHEKERNEMGIKARESTKRYDKNIIMRQWIDLFDELTKK